MNPRFNIKTYGRIPELDGLRGLAISLVVLCHYVVNPVWWETAAPARFIRAVFPLAWSGVDLFFVLSGFLIGGILLDQRHAENYFKTFYIRRACRILPFYYLWLALFFIVSWMFSSHLHQKWQAELFAQNCPKWSYLVFLQNFFVAKAWNFGPHWVAVAWSLTLEEQFYLLSPLVIRFMPIRRLPHVLISLILFVPLCRLYLYVYHQKIFMHVLLPCRADALLMGVLCAYLVRSERPRRWLEKNQGRLYPALIILLAGTGYLTAYANSVWTSFELVFLGYSWLALFYACLLLIVITAKNGLIVSVMRLPPLRYLGLIAYGVFLMHMTINELAHGLLLGQEPHITGLADVSVTIVALGATLGLAALSWHFFEKPIIRWGHTFSYIHKNTEPPG